MTSEPAPEPYVAPSRHELDALRADRDAWEARAREAEGIAEQLADEIVSMRRELEEGHLFQDVPAEHDATVAADGSDPRVLPIVVAAVAVVMTMVALLSILNNGLFSFATFIIVVIALGLWWGAYQVRVVKARVSFVRSVVLIEIRDETYRFDLREKSTNLQVVGTPDDPSWCVHFVRRGLKPLTVDATMVDPAEFMTSLRQYRPDL